MLKPLQPGIQPLGQFDLDDDDVSVVKGGEVAVFADAEDGEGYAADVPGIGPLVKLKLGTVSTTGKLYGLVDEGDSGYGTMFGTLVGGTAGQGTGYGAMSSVGSVVIGPKTTYGSGKATLWAQPGLYGVSVEGFVNSTQYDGLGANDALYGTASTGKLTTTSTNTQAALSLGLAKDTSLVSTTNTQAGETVSKTEYALVYLLGVQGA